MIHVLWLGNSADGSTRCDKGEGRVVESREGKKTPSSKLHGNYIATRFLHYFYFVQNLI